MAGSISVIGGSVTGSAGAGLLVVDNLASGPTVLFSGVVLRNVARFDTGQNKGQHAAPIHLIDSIGGEPSHHVLTPRRRVCGTAHTAV